MRRRLTLAMVLVFIPLVLLMGSLLVTRSFTLAMERETERAQLTQSLVMEGLRPELSRLSYAQLVQAVARYRTLYAAQGIEMILCYRGTPLGGAQFPRREYDGLLTGARSAMLDTMNKPERYAIAEPVTEDLTVLMLRDVSDLYVQRDEMWQTFLLYGILGALTVAGISFLLAWWFARPVRMLTKAARRMTEDAFSAPALPLGRQDELGALAQAFDEMRSAVLNREEALRKEAKARQELLDALSHEMRTPLCSILGNTRLLQSTPLTENDRAKLLGTIAQETKRLSELDMQLMKLTELSNEEIEKHPVSGNALLNDCAQRLQSQFDGMTIHVEVCENSMLFGDSALLALLLDNLAVNALRASQPGQTVTLTALPQGFSVRDEGVGMTEEQLTHVFEPFYKTDKARTRKAGGAGLGLSLCRRIAQLHGGMLTLQSKPGEGTQAIFTTLLPAVADSVTKPAVSFVQEVNLP